MGAVPVQILRVIIWLCLAGSLLAQLGLVPLALWEMADSGAPPAGEALLLCALAVFASVVNRLTPGDELAPGLVGLICGASLVLAGVALVIYVQRQLLVQATETLARAEGLQSELDEVI